MLTVKVTGSSSVHSVCVCGSQGHLPSAPAWPRRFGNQGPRRNPARERMGAPPGCGSAPARLPRRLYPLEGKTDGAAQLED